MVIALVIVAVLVLAGIVVLATAARSGERTTGKLSRETRAADAGSGRPASTEIATVDSAEARERAAQIREATGGVPAAAGRAEVARWEPVDEEELGVTRRQFFNRGILAAVGLGVATLGAGVLAFLWPTSSGGFGGIVKTGRTIDDILGEIEDKKTPAYFAEARAYVNPYPAADVDNAIAAGYDDAIVANLEQGFIVLYQKCPHLGCRVPWCQSSQWFECPCHGSKYNRVGEKRGGPAPSGMFQWVGAVADDQTLSIDTSTVIAGMPIGTDSTGQKPEGPFCV